MARRKFIGQVKYHVGGAPDDLYELTIIFNRKSDMSTTSWLQIADAVSRFSEDSDTYEVQRPRTLTELGDTLAREQAERDVLGMQIKEILMAFVLVSPDFIGHVISDAYTLLADEDTPFPKPLTVKDRDRLKLLYREIYKLHRRYRRSLR